MSSASRSVLLPAVGIAALLHIALVGLGPWMGANKAPVAIEGSIGAIEVDLLTDESPKPSAEPERDRPDEAAQANDPPREAEEEAPRSTQAKSVSGVAIEKGPAEPSRAVEGDSENTSPGKASPAPAPPSNGGYDAPAPLVVPGVNGAPAWAIPGVIGPAPIASAAPTAAPSPKPVDSDVAGKVLSGSLQKKDQNAGIDLPAAGAVASAIVGAVRTADVPTDAKASFEVRLSREGKVEGIRLLGANAGSGPAWDRVVKGAAAGLAGKTLAMNGVAAQRGAVVTVKIESKPQFPAGTKEKADVQPVCIEEQIIAAADAVGGSASGHGPITEPGVGRSAPDIAAQHADRKWCLPVGVRAKGDLANSGAHAQTVVSSKVSVVIPGLQPLDDIKPIDHRAPWSSADPNSVQLPRDWKKRKPKKKN